MAGVVGFHLGRISVAGMEKKVKILVTVSPMKLTLVDQDSDDLRRPGRTLAGNNLLERNFHAAVRI